MGPGSVLGGQVRTTITNDDATPVANDLTGLTIGRGRTLIVDLGAQVTDADDDKLDDGNRGEFDPAAMVGMLGLVGEGATELDVTLDGGTLTLTVPENAELGPFSFTYTATDQPRGPDTGNSADSVGIISGEIAEPGPESQDDAVTIDEDIETVIDVLVNDIDAGGGIDAMSLAIIVGPDNGMITKVDGTTGEITYKPNKDFNGSASFKYSVRDNMEPANLGDLATVSVTVTPVNDGPPNAANDMFSVAEDLLVPIVLKVLENDDTGVDADETLTITSLGIDSMGLTPVGRGTATITDDGTTITYMPAGNFDKTDSFFYVVSDGSDGSVDVRATVSVVIVPEDDDAPSAADADVVVDEDETIVIDVLTNDDTGVDLSETLIMPLVQSTSGMANVTDQGGNVFISGGGTTVTYTPPGDFFSADAEDTDSFNYVIDDGTPNGEGGELAEATVTVTVNAVNDAPVVQNTNMLIYIPIEFFVGIDSLFYTVGDGNGGTDLGMVTITVTAASPPDGISEAVDDDFTINEDAGAMPLNVLLNDVLEPGEMLTITSAVALMPVDAGMVMVSPGAATVTFTPTGDFNGLVTFDYTISDGGDSLGEAGTGTVSVTVLPVNDAPSPMPDSGAGFEVVEESGANLLDVLANDSDLEDDALTVALTVVAVTQGGQGGVVAIAEKGSMVTYAPTANFVGFESFTYTVSDSNGDTAIGNVTVNVTDVNDPPTRGGRHDVPRRRLRLGRDSAGRARERHDRTGHRGNADDRFRGAGGGTGHDRGQQHE